MSAYLKSLARRMSPAQIPLFPLSGTVLLPGCELPLNIFEPRYLNMIDDALRSERLIGFIQPDTRLDEDSSPQNLSLCKVGTLSRIKQYSESDDGRYLISLVGLKRFTLTSHTNGATPYRQGLVSYQAYEHDPDIFTARNLPQAMIEKTVQRAEFIVAMKAFAKVLSIEIDWPSLDRIHIDQIVDQCTMIGPFAPADKQALLEAKTAEDRRHLIISLMELHTAKNAQNDPREKRDN